MVNPISSNNVTRLRPAGEAETAQTRGGATAAPQPRLTTGTAADDVSLSAAAGRLPEALTKGPPVDRALVDRIGEAIAEGRYPIRPDLIAEALFRDVQDMNS
jgi:negative regulator of flagellin synthesis FlgM